MKATLSISTTVLKRHQRAGKYTMSILAACGGLKTIRNNLTIRSPQQASMACWNSSANATSSLRQASVHDNAYNRPGVNTIECPRSAQDGFGAHRNRRGAGRLRAAGAF